MPEPAVDDGRCSRTHGERWRCRSPRFGGSNLCEHHLFYKRPRPDSDSSVARVCNASAIKEDEVKKKTTRRRRKKITGLDPSIAKMKMKMKNKRSKKLDGPLDVGGGDGGSMVIRASDQPAEMKKKRGRPRKVMKLDDIGEKKRGIPRKRIKFDPSADEKQKKRRPRKRSKLDTSVDVKKEEDERRKRGTGVEMTREEEDERRKRGTDVEMTREEEDAGRVMSLGQVWAFLKGSDGIPRSYARIDRILPLSASVRVTPIVSQPVLDEEKLFALEGIPLACGLFEAADSTLVKEISAFTHKVMFEIDGEGSPFYKIFPKKGEIWAVYLRWVESTKSFEYKLVEVDSDFSEEDGVNVFGLARVQGMDGVYARQVHEGFYLVRNFSRRSMSMFSHRVLAYRIVEGGEMFWKLMSH